jgi:hypothetical protein
LCNVFLLMIVKIITIILRNTYTTDDLMDRLGLMRRYYEAILFKKEGEHPEQRSIQEFFAHEREEYTLEVLETWFAAFQAQHIDPLVVYEALDAIEEDIAGLPTMALYIPIRFSHEHIARFGEWFRAHVQPNILLSIRIDARVTGGCGFVWNNEYQDFSLRYYLQKHRGRLIDMYENYTHVSL